MIHERKKRISGYLKEILEQQISQTDNRTKNKAIAEELVKLALNPEVDNKLRLSAIEVIMDRLEGKALQTNVNADISSNPFEDVPTEKLEALKAKLLNTKTDEG